MGRTRVLVVDDIAALRHHRSLAAPVDDRLR